ncbi:MAG: hypothetical protein HOP36_17470 [Methyloglobulus sp.]|nr:hypothetical protein [Methyloglobulus sp.]
MPVVSPGQGGRPGLLALFFVVYPRKPSFYFMPVNQLMDTVKLFQSFMVFDKGIA